MKAGCLASCLIAVLLTGTGKAACPTTRAARPGKRHRASFIGVEYCYLGGGKTIGKLGVPVTIRLLS